MITKEEYYRYAEDGFNVIPLIKPITLASKSPIEIYSKIKDKENTFLLESIEGGEKWAQYSIIGKDCKDTIKISGQNIEINTKDKSIMGSDKISINKINDFKSKKDL